MFKPYGKHCAIIYRVPNSEGDGAVYQYRDTEAEIKALAEEYAKDGYDVAVYLNDSFHPSYKLEGAEIA